MTTEAAASAELAASRSLVAQQNRKQQKSGGFQSMGLSAPVFKGVRRKGYRVPTPIQRKTVPHILAGRDVVAMARTGSGKTAAFLIPMLERLRAHQCGGARALVLSPTRELAMQTLDFCRAIGKFTDLSVALVLGGDSMDQQFTALHSNPDIIVASPGRLLHLLTEMEARLSRVQVLVLDECDRLFELGFQEQISLLLTRLPAQRQTLLFSATLPERVADFARAGLSDPLLIRLDVDAKLSQQLRLSFLACRDEDKLPLLLHLLHNALAGQELTLVFAATKHHVEWLQQTLSRDPALSITYLYSAMDPAARRLHAAMFRSGEKSVMITTDLAARGLDLPRLNHVVNFHFPPKEKLFVHRVGRVARAGKSGTAVSLVAPDEMPYLYDLEMFLGARKLHFLRSDGEEVPPETDCVGSVPTAAVAEFADWCRNVLDTSADLQSQLACAVKAEKQYLRSRPGASREAVKKHKAAGRDCGELRPHPLFAAMVTAEDSVLRGIKAYRARATIFETKHAPAAVSHVMQQFRKKTALVIEKRQAQKQQQQQQQHSDWLSGALQQQQQQQQQQQKPGFIAYARDAAEAATERGLALDLQQSSFDILGDEVDSLRRRQMWDRKRKKFVAAESLHQQQQQLLKKKVLVRTEGGQLVPASYKTDRYAKWRKRNPQHAEAPKAEEGDGEGDGEGEAVGYGEGVRVLGTGRKRRGPPQSATSAATSSTKSERRNEEEIVKARKVRAANLAKNRKKQRRRRR